MDYELCEELSLLESSTLYSASYIEASFTIIFEFYILVASVISICLHHYICYTTIF